MPTANRKVLLGNKYGLHVRPATMVAQTASRYQSDISITKDGVEVDGKSVLEMISLGAECGSELNICASGEDAEEAVSSVAELVNSHFHEDE